MAIACVYCGGAHPTAGEVRQCWERSQHDGQLPGEEHAEHGRFATGAEGGRHRHRSHGRGRTGSGEVRTCSGATSSSPADANPRPTGTGASGSGSIRTPCASPFQPSSVLRAAAFERRGVVIELDRRHGAGRRRAPTSPRVGRAIRLRRRRAAPSRVVELRRRARSRRAEVVARRSGRGARCRDSAARPMSCSPTVRPRGSTAGRSASPIRSTGGPVLHAVAVEHGSLAPPRVQHVRRRPRRRPARRRRPRRRRGPHHRPRRLRQDPRAHRAGPSPARQLATAAERRQPRRVQQAGPGGDARTHRRPARPAGPHAQRDRARHRQRRPHRSLAQARTWRTIDEPDVRRVLGRSWSASRSVATPTRSRRGSRR